MQVNTIWTNCYDGSWKDVIVPEAFSHPAKMSYGLLKRILDHAGAWLNKGDVIVDPFGGIGSTGILGAYEGYQVVCVELEQDFNRMAKGFDCPGLSKNEWIRWYNRFNRNSNICPTCHIKAQTWYEKHSGTIPSQESHHFVGNFELHKTAWHKFGNPYPIILQGDSRRLCDVVEKADCIVSSPPFLETGTNITKASRNTQVVTEAINDIRPYLPEAKKVAIYLKERRKANAEKQCSYRLESKVSLICSSPPYEEGIGHGGNPTTLDKKKALHIVDSKRYSATNENLGNQRGDTFWSTAKTILEQCHQILKQGGHAIWVVKSFVRRGRIVDFPGDWQRLCESVGFKTVCIHHAMLVKEMRHQTLFGHTEVKRKERKSFFRRLAESKGSPRIDFEVVLCMEKCK